MKRLVKHCCTEHQRRGCVSALGLPRGRSAFTHHREWLGRRTAPIKLHIRTGPHRSAADARRSASGLSLSFWIFPCIFPSPRSRRSGIRDLPARARLQCLCPRRAHHIFQFARMLPVSAPFCRAITACAANLGLRARHSAQYGSIGHGFDKHKNIRRAGPLTPTTGWIIGSAITSASPKQRKIFSTSATSSRM